MNSIASTQDPMVRLRCAVVDFSTNGFAVIDGGNFEDLPALLKKERLLARSLFLDTADSAVQSAGPWLVALAQEQGALDKVLALLGENFGATFYHCDAGEAVLWRHLRTLNVIKIPSWAANGYSSPNGEESDEPAEIVTFRHWDPEVLVCVLPTFDTNQFVRFLGPVNEIALIGKTAGFRLVKQLEGSSAKPGVLTLRAEQILAIQERKQDASDRRIAAYLREASPDRTANMRPDDLLNYIEEARGSGRILGIRDEQALGLWIYLMMETGGEIARQKEVRLFISRGASPDRQLFEMMNDAIRLRTESKVS